MSASPLSDDCPEPPSMRAAPRAHILHEACDAAGSISKLALRLGVSVAALNLWLDGTEEPPLAICQACAQIVLLA